MQRDRLSHLLARTRDPAFALTARAEIWAWNPAAEAVTGFAAEDALHQSFTTLVDARGPLGKRLDAGYCEQAIGAGGVATFDLELRTASGPLIWLNISVLVFEPLRVSPALVVHIAHDITASRRRRSLYERLRETSREITQLVDEEHHFVPVPPLTRQEQRVLTLLSKGRTPAQVARELDISAQTIRNHLHHVNQKLGTHNRLEAVVHAVHRRLI